MHKINLDNNRENKLEFSRLQSFLLINIGFLNGLTKQKIKFNPKPVSNKIKTKDITINKKPDENIVDLHLDLIKRIDKLIKENNKLTKIVHDPLYLNARMINSPLSNIVEIREPELRKPEMPLYNNELKTNNINSDIRLGEEFFEVEFPKVNPKETEQNDENLSWMINSKEADKTINSVGKIKIRLKNKDIKTKPTENKETKTQTTNNNVITAKPIENNSTNTQTKEDNYISKTKIELEKTKKEIEEKKIALEKALKEEKLKELELKKIAELKEKEEKLKKLEIKKREKEEKMKLREQLKLQKQKEKEEKKLQKLRSKIPEIKPEEKKEELPKEVVDILERQKTIDNKKETTTTTDTLDEDLAKLMPVLDSLFDNLPEEIIQRFAQSKEFEIYEKLMLKYSNK